MEKIKRINRNSLSWKFIPYIFVMVFAMVAGFAALGLSANAIQEYLRQNYAKENRTLQNEPMYSESGELIMFMRVEEMYEWNRGIYKLLYKIADVGQVVLGIPWAFICLFLPGMLFYRRYLKEPLGLLMDGAEKIGKNNLDFQIVYKRKDEMGQLCSAFEKMRLALQENNLQMWRTMEDRKRLNAAFAHDLRTPLTVLKGQTDMLIRFVPQGRMPEEKIVSTAATMKKHIGRLEDYVQTMNHLQRLEDIEIRRKEVQTEELVWQLLESGRAVCGAAEGQRQEEKRQGSIQQEGQPLFQIDASRLKSPVQILDMDIVMQVCENLFSNAARYAKQNVTAVLSDEMGFTVTVQDDGPGFSEKDLEKADQPFYHADKGEAGEHMGMGLHICRVLCERHGGYLRLFNGRQGACVKACF
ncbi:MAG: HAMP domain-containing sensor histidine kinase [Lachnospiraceae bacterium]|nr:HAMP domain-containing sensor histidine kinase [Lachnospiraceae bacterium]